MRRYVSVKRSASGVCAVTVSFVDGDLSARWTVKSYTGQQAKALAEAEANARKALEEIRVALDNLAPLPADSPGE